MQPVNVASTASLPRLSVLSPRRHLLRAGNQHGAAPASTACRWVDCRQRQCRRSSRRVAHGGPAPFLGMGRRCTARLHKQSTRCAIDKRFAGLSISTALRTLRDLPDPQSVTKHAIRGAPIMYKLLFGLAALFGAMTMTGRAFAEDGTPANGPTKLTDAQLDEVTAGHTPALTLAARHEGHCHHHHHHHHHHNRAVFGASGLPG